MRDPSQSSLVGVVRSIRAARIDAERGFASVVAIQSDKKEIEVGLIGREGMTGMPIVLGNHRSPHTTYAATQHRRRRSRLTFFPERSPCLADGDDAVVWSKN